MALTGQHTEPLNGDFANSNHDHEDAAGGGQLAGAALVTGASGHGYVELANIPWASGDTLDTGTIPAMNFLKIIVTYTGGAEDGVDLRFNNDSGSNYASRRFINGSSSANDTTATSLEVAGNYAGVSISVLELANIAAGEKIGFNSWAVMRTAGAANSANGAIYYEKWANTADQITRVTAIRRSAATFGAGSRLIVMGKN